MKAQREVEHLVTETAAGLRVESLEDRTIVVVYPPAGWLALVLGLVWGGSGVFGILTPNSWEAGALTPFLLLVFFVVPGARILIEGCRDLIIERAWLVRKGEMALRRRLRGLTVTTLGRFRPVVHLEVREGTWRSGRGRTDTLRIYLEGAKRPTDIASRETIGRTTSAPPGGVIHPEILALAQVFARAADRRLEFITEAIDDPSRGD